MDRATSHVMNTYNNLPVYFTRGEGAWLWDEDGRRYLDGLAGIAVNTVGHRHPRLMAALEDQIEHVIHTSNLFKIRGQEQVAARLCALSGMDNVFFCNSGLEANEAAIKIARKYGHDRGVDLPEIIVFEGSFHGRSLATLSATANPKVHQGFEPLVTGFVRAPLNDLDALKRIAKERKGVVAVFLEAIQGEGGINAAHLEFLAQLRALCDEQQWLLMIDEVQCGVGRTGKWFAHQWADIIPDVMPLAKGLGSGVPIGAVVARGKAAHVFQYGNHGTTFGGNPLAMRAANETLSIIEDEGLLANAASVGSGLIDDLRKGLTGTIVKEVRGRGLMIGIELDRPCGDLVKDALAYTDDFGLVINVTNERVVRLLPPLIFTPEEASILAEGLIQLITSLAQRNG